MPLTILHISDLHLSESKFKDYELVRSAFFDDLKNHRANGTPPDLVIFSGDLVQAGNSFKNFEFAYDKFILPLFDVLQIPDDRLLIVPGNHDVDLDAITATPEVEDGLFSHLSDRDKLNNFIDRNLVSAVDNPNFRRLATYHEFRAFLASPPTIRQTPFFTTHVTDIGGSKVGISCLNSAWRATSGPNDKDYGRLLIGERAITESLKDIQECATKLAIFHHPISWLRQFDQQDCRTLLQKEFDLIFTGHLHIRNPEFRVTPQGRALLSEAGALYASRRHYNGYCFVRISEQRDTADFLFRRYEDEIRQFAPENIVGDAGRYVVNLEGPTDRDVLSTNPLLHATRQIFEELLTERIMIDSSVPVTSQKIDEYFIPVPISTTSGFVESPLPTHEPPKFVTSAYLISSTRPVLVFGPRESGKTTFGLHLGWTIASTSNSSQQVPVYLDLTSLKAGTENVQRAIKAFLARTGVAVALNDLLDAGSLFIVVDNFGRQKRSEAIRDRKVEMLETFMKKFPRNSFLFLCNEDSASTIGGGTKSEYQFEHDRYFIRPLDRNKIRAIVRRRLEAAGLYNAQNVENLVRQIDAAHLPRSAYIVSTLLWAFQNGKITGPVNEATILEYFVNAILNKANLENVERDALDFKLKEHYLAHLAHRITMDSMAETEQDDEEYSIGKNELIQFTLDFFKARSWPYDSTQFVLSLIKSGVLVERETTDGLLDVRFHYECLCDYFAAKFMQFNTQFVRTIFHNYDEAIKWGREIDIYTGLTRNDTFVSNELLNEVLKFAVRDRAPTVFTEFLEVKRPNVVMKAIMDALEASAAESGADGDVKELAVSMEEFREKMAAKLGRLHGEDYLERSQKFFFSNALLSRVIRNNELVDDVQQKIDAVNATVDGWCYAAMEGALRIDRFAKGLVPPEELEEYNSLSDGERQLLELLSKVQGPLVIMHACNDCLGTSKLRSVFLTCYANTDERDALKRLMLLSLLIDLSFAERQRYQNDIFRMIAEFSRTYSKGSLALTILTSKLAIVYRGGGLSEVNRAALEDSISDLYQVTMDIPAGQRSFVREQIVKQLRSQASSSAAIGESTGGVGEVGNKPTELGATKGERASDMAAPNSADVAIARSIPG